MNEKGTEKDSKSSLSAKSKKSRSPGKNESPVKSAKSSKSQKSSKSKSPKRKLTGSQKVEYYDSSYFEMPKSTPELEDMTGQGLTILDAKLFQKITLRTLILSGNNLRFLPTAIIDLINLEHLDLSRNPLRVKDMDDSKCLPVEMRLLRNLKYLSLSECNLRYIPSTVWCLMQLKGLDLSRNKIGLLVPDIGNLQNLTYLNLSQCNLTTLPVEIGFCTELVEILLMANQIESLPDSLKDCYKLENLKMSYRSFTALLDSYMENLISKGQIKSEHVPIVVFELENLRTLDLKHTKINNLPENNLKNLRELYIDYNYFETFTEIPIKSIGQQLKVLTISNNLLKEIPNELLNLPNLEVLDLSFNKINILPNRFNLTKLKELYLNNNCLKAIAGSVSSLLNLEKFNVEKNEINEISDLIFINLKNMNYFDLSYNKVARISPKISQLALLKSAHSYDKMNKIGLWVIGNPLIVPPKEIWQTTNLQKIYNYLLGYNQKNLNYTYYAKLMFLGCSGIGKSNLIDSFFDFKADFDSTNKIDFRTVIARKFYKRTSNKVEWMILDFGGHELYKLTHSLFFSSIDHQIEPVLFVVVYNHSEYTNDNYENFIGSWIKSILAHSKLVEKFPIQIKLIGITDSKKNEVDHNQILTEIKQNSKRTIVEYYDKLNRQKEIIVKLLNTQNITEDNKSYLDNLLKRIESSLKSRVNLYEDVTLIDSEFRKKCVEKVINDLENITIKFNKTVPLGLNTTLKSYLPKLKTNIISYHQLYENLGSNSNIKNLLDSNKNLTLTYIINYAMTIGEIFWFKFDNDLNEKIYLHYEYIMNCLKLILRHDLVEHLKSDEIKIFNSIGFFENENEFENLIKLCYNYGILEEKLFKFLCFSSSQMTKDEISYSIDLLNQFLILYKSDSQYLEDKCSFFRVILPFMCNLDYEAEKDEIEDKDLFSNEFYKYFIRLDKIRYRREEIKELNAMKKQRELWNSQENENFNESEAEDSLRQSRLSISEKFHFEAIKFDYSEEIKRLKDISEEEIKKFKIKAVYEIGSTIEIEWHFFNKLSILIQEFVYERHDWKNVLVARDINGTCFRIQNINNKKDNNYSIVIEMFGSDIKFLEILKQNLNKVFDKLNVYYPGLFFTKKILFD